MSDICAPALNDTWNNEIITQCFHNNLKLVDMTPVLKKDDASLLKNYRPVSVLPVVSKTYEKIKNYAETDFRVYRQAFIFPFMWI